MHVIYGLFDPGFARFIRYVGYTSKPLNRRLIEHISEAKSRRSNHRHKWIRSLLEIGSQPEIIELEVVTEESWKERESFWITQFPHNNLVNSTSGGEGLINPSVEVRRKIGKKVSIGLMGNQRRTGVPHDDESKKRISEGLRKSAKKKVSDESRRGRKQKPRSEETREKIRQSKLGKKRAPFTAEHLENMRLASIGKRQSSETIAKRSLTLIGNQRSKGVIRSEHTKQLMREAWRGSKWITNGATSRRHKPDDSMPDGWSYGRKKKD